MKKLFALLVALIALLSFVGCSKATGESSTDEGDSTYLEVENSPLDGGLLITVDKNEGTINMQITDKNGNETTEYYKFTPASTTCERYRYVSMMGTGFYYTYDYESGEILTILNNDEEDVTQSTKDSGRFEGALSETKEYVDNLIAYYEETFDKTLSEAIE